MKQNPIQSNLPVVAQRSATTQILYQQPTQAEMHPSFIQGAVSKLQNISLGLVLVGAFIFTPLTIMRGCADDVERQHAMAVKHQVQFGGAK